MKKHELPIEQKKARQTGTGATENVAVGQYIGLYRAFGEHLIGLGFLYSVSYTKINPNPRKIICCGKKIGPNATFDLIFLGLGWPWVGEFVGFIVISTR